MESISTEEQVRRQAGVQCERQTAAEVPESCPQGGQNEDQEDDYVRFLYGVRCTNLPPRIFSDDRSGECFGDLRTCYFGAGRGG